MNDRSHEIPQRASNDSKQLINKAMREGYLVYIKYRDFNGRETERNIEPLEWVEDDKIRAYCHQRREERHFVISRIREICLVAKPNSDVHPNTHSLQTTAQRPISSLEQWRIADPASTDILHTVTTKPAPKFKPDQLFSQVTSPEQWRQLVSYYRECLNREYLQDYIIDQKHRDNYHFFPTEEDLILRFLAGDSSFSFPTTIHNQPVDIVEFINNPAKREMQLCIGYPSLLTPDGKIAPLFFTPCGIEKHEDVLYLRSDEYELSYAILHSLDLDKEEFAVIVAELNQFEFDDLATRIKALQEALVEKLGELLANPIPRREANRPQMVDVVDQTILFTTPCLFWASKNNITQTLIEELEEISKRPWASTPQSLLQLLNTSVPDEYPASIPLARDHKVFTTRINDEQRKACHAALMMPITVVTGPPGTGKSQLVANIIANAVIEGKSVLFASRNNRAVDVVVERLRNDMHFSGMIRTGNRTVRKDAANEMLTALSKAAILHQTPEIISLLERYRKTKLELANQLEVLEEIQRLKASLLKKRQQFEETLADLPQELAGLFQNEMMVTDPSAIDLDRQLITSIMRTYQIMQQRIDAIGTVLQEHITDNQHRHAFVCDIEDFETEWGRFGTGIRDADYFPTIESLQRYIDFWMRLLDAVETRILIEKATHKAETLEKKLAALTHSLPAGLQLEVQNVAMSISEDKLNDLKRQITSIDSLINHFQKLSFSNWFGLRRGPQINIIVAAFEPLLNELEQPSFREAPRFDELKKQIETLKNYFRAIVGTRSLINEQRKLQRANAKLVEQTNLLGEQTQRDLSRLKIQHSEPIVLRQELVKLAQEVSKLLSQRNAAVAVFRKHLDEIPPLENLWSQFQNEVGKEEYAGWTLDGEISIDVLQHFASQWLSMLNAVELRTAIEHLNGVIRSRGGEEGVITRVELVQQRATAQAIEILNNTWLKNIDDLRSDRVQQVKDYASLLREVSENYDSHKYSSMMSIQETYTDDIIAAFPVWATTNLSISRNLPLRAELFDLVIIDEASQCDIPSALPLIYRAKQAIIIGDAMQLRHIATLTEDSHQILAAEHNVATEAYSYIQHSLFDLAARSVGQHPGILMLREHYRSHERIISFSNQAFYNGNLIIKTDMTNRNIPASVIKNACGMYWLNVPGETIHPSGGSAKNLHEITAIKHILPTISELLKQIGWDGSIGIVTPYREQKNAIQSWVDSQTGQHVTVGTAHTFQGDEREILLFSPVLAPGISDGSLAWLKRTENLLNVAITRARTTLIIVGDFDFCMSLPENNPYRNLAEYVRAKTGTVLQSWDELPIISLKV